MFRKYNHNPWIKLLTYILLYFLLLAVTICYQFICEFGGAQFTPTSLKTIIDHWTPVNIYIMWPYIACLTYVPMSGLLFAFNRKISVVQLTSFYLSVIATYLLTYLIYIFFPTTASEVMLTNYNGNEHLFINKGMFEHLQEMYKMSTPLGDFPSLHVAPLVILGLFLYYHWKILFWIFLPLGFLGAIGTFVLKFHTFSGFIGGGIIGVIGYYFVYTKLIYNNLNRKKQQESV